ncbi:DUF1361 domain-containing protein [Puia dinghuensis]|uniref:Membrane protein n=1 Tax=Puia dinghuensis TaxID=1792502 RepID=A0A8J2UGN2_9BACT|nr:DUF1361 domain-containing protein [Puia dinghuensis]GGB14148.1 membrane protein [Puia dinghuensis]
MTTLSFSSTHFRKYFFLRTEIDRLLTASILFSSALIAIRMLHTGTTLFLWLLWNLFLAYIPYAISTWLTNRQGKGLSRAFSLLMGIVWLLFLPNTFYILTDLYHLHDSRHPLAPEWLDLALIFSCAWNGLLLGVLSLRHMEKLLWPDTRTNWLFLIPLMALNALGIYTGRYLRYNSWDILSNPFQLITDIARMIIHPLRNQYAWDMIACYTILLLFIYSMMKKIGHALS